MYRGINFTLKMMMLFSRSSRTFSTSASVTAARALNARLDKASDPELYSILEKEKKRQRNSLVLIASENYAPRRVFDALGTVMVSVNKY